MQEIKITPREENQRLDKYLMKYMNKAPKGFLYKMLRKKRIKYNGGKAEGNEILQTGDTLQLYLAEETISSFMEEKTIPTAERHFGIVYEDDNLLVVNKPAGLLSHPQRDDERNTLIDQILSYLYEKGQYNPKKDSTFTPALCNRLDRNTSGIVIAGKTLAAVQAVNEAIRKGTVEKYYLTLVAGTLDKAGEISYYLAKDQEKNEVHTAKAKTAGFRSALTKYRPLAHTNAYTLLEIQLITGKTHQIRAHMQAIGHPVAGDRKYGDEEINRRIRQDFALSNQCLHAEKIRFLEKEGFLSYLYQKELTAPMPQKMQAACTGLFGNTWGL